ncbi:MAG: carboxypeptidase regulatory-like domain-containing protein [Bryobacterales bacterium]|nr:carboxypeptidase regulatory-like domain-containing protein [Bryobacterales bacterium]
MTWAQSTSSLRGAITDAQGAAIDTASITLQNAEVGFRRSVLSDATGIYQFVQVPPGLYSVSVEKPGFASVTKTSVELLVNTPTTFDVTMQIASVTETVNVEADVVKINTVDASIGNSFNETQVRQLPLQTRNVVELLSLQPGVTQTGEVLGSRRDQNNIVLDGVDANDNQNSGLGGLGTSTKTALPGLNGQGIDRKTGFNAALPVPLDSVEEFRVTVGGEGADQGRSSGGQVTLVTKSGTNQFHGSAYEFNRNTVFSANDWFNNQSGVARQPLNRNQYGFSVGGPIKKDRVFFFFNYERRTDRSANSQLSHVPSEAMKQGILTFQNTNGNITTLRPAAMTAIDPLHIGDSAAILSMLNQFPAGNNPATGVDSGLNFSGFRFNAPQNLTYNAYVGKMDFHIDPAGKHTLSVRGTLAGNNETLTPQSFPGQPINNVLLNNSRGVAVSYTGLLTPNLVNVASFGLTRIGFNQTGPTGTAFSIDSIDPFVNYSTRGYIRIAPTYNWVDDLTWTKGKHTITAGMNLRFVRNGYTNFTNAWPNYSYSRGSLTGLGSDWLASMQTYLTSTGGDSTMVNSQAVVRAAGDLLGIISGGTMNYIYDHTGNALPIGSPAVRNFASNEYGLYVSDSWRIKPGMTLTAGLRYENNTPPWEMNGLQVAPTIPLQNYWAARVGGAEAGLPSYAATPAESYNWNGPGNGTSSWFDRNKLNFAPRIAVAYSPQSDSSLAAKILGKGGVFRAGGSIVYDRFGSDMVVQFDTANSFGLTENDILGSFNFASASRYNGTFPALPAASVHTFPFTPPNVAAVCCTYVGIDSNLKTPYAYVVNASAARPLKGGITLEIGYQGRFSHALLLQTDIGGVNWDFTDPTGAGSLADAQRTMRNDYLALSNNSIQATPAVQKQVAANPSIVPIDPFVEKYFGSIKNLYFPGSASANYLYLLMSNGMSDTDTLNQADRLHSVNGKSFPNCISVTGCWSFYAPQQSSLNAWTNNGSASYNSATVTVRRGLSKGFAFDFNYTLGHSIDNGGGAESGRGAYGGLMLDPYNYKAFRGSSDFDIRHNINANLLYELPFGKGKAVLGNASAFVDELVGGWQASTIMRYHSGLPTAIFYGGIWPTNFSFGAVAYPINPAFSTSNGIDAQGNPGMFQNPAAAAGNWLPMYAGNVGSRAAARLAAATNFDIAVAKAFRLPFERQRLQFRAEAFNAFNHANFLNPSLDASSPSTFGEYTQDAGPRVIQLGLRYEF